MNEVSYDNLSPDGIADTFRQFSGPLVLRAPEVACGKYPGEPAVCSDQTQFFQYEGAGVFTRGLRLAQAARVRK